jgi:hypothetical protein
MRRERDVGRAAPRASKQKHVVEEEEMQARLEALLALPTIVKLSLLYKLPLLGQQGLCVWTSPQHWSEFQLTETTIGD